MTNERTDAQIRPFSIEIRGHFAAMEAPDLLTGGVRNFFRPLR
jgi:hypothetical protein